MALEISIDPPDNPVPLVFCATGSYVQSEPVEDPFIKCLYQANEFRANILPNKRWNCTCSGGDTGPQELTAEIYVEEGALLEDSETIAVNADNSLPDSPCA